MTNLPSRLSITHALFAIALFLALGTARAQSEVNALTMVKAVGLGKNLSVVSYMAAKNTQTYFGIVATIGVKNADELIKKELAVSVSNYQDRWDNNLAQAWAPLLTNAEMDSLAQFRQLSPFAAKFMSLQKTAGDAMQAKSQPLLVALVTEAVARAFDAATPRK